MLTSSFVDQECGQSSDECPWERCEAVDRQLPEPARGTCPDRVPIPPEDDDRGTPPTVPELPPAVPVPPLETPSPRGVVEGEEEPDRSANVAAAADSSDDDPDTSSGSTPDFGIYSELTEELVVFQNQFGEPCAWSLDGGTYFIQSADFTGWLVGRFLAVFKRLPRKKEVKELRWLLECHAMMREQVSLSNRHAEENGRVCIDLGDSDWNEIVVDGNGWEVRQQDRPRFFRASHALAHPVPVTGGNYLQLFDFLSDCDDQDQLLILAWVLSAMCPHIASPILLVVGMQGSAKTTMCRLIRSLVDPSTIPLLGAVEQKDMMQVLHHHALPCLENVGQFSRKEADILCRAVTGDSIERRKLYTNKDSVIFGYRRPIIINGTDIPPSVP
jgi:hypothetical protein